MGFVKEASDDVGSPLGRAEIAADVGDHLAPVPGALAPESVGFHILVQ